MSASDIWTTYATALLRSVGAAENRLASTVRSTTHLRASVIRELDAVEPQAGAPSLGDALRTLIHETQRAPSDPHRVRRGLVELKDLYARASFRRTKRAERGWLLAKLVVLFELEPALGLPPGTGDDEGAHLKRVRRALQEP